MRGASERRSEREKKLEPVLASEPGGRAGQSELGRVEKIAEVQANGADGRGVMYANADGVREPVQIVGRRRGAEGDLLEGAVHIAHVVEHRAGDGGGGVGQAQGKAQLLVGGEQGQASDGKARGG